MLEETQRFVRVCSWKRGAGSSLKALTERSREASADNRDIWAACKLHSRDSTSDGQMPRSHLGWQRQKVVAGEIELRKRDILQYYGRYGIDAGTPETAARTWQSGLHNTQ